MADRIVGIDFGTSTSAIRVRRYVDGKPDKPVPDAVMFNSTPVVPTLIQKQADIHSAYYGYDAEVPKKRATVYQNFKLDLEHPDQAVREEAKALTAEYLKECLGKEYQHQSEAGFLGASDDTVTTFISYPVKWSKETCAFMIQAAKDAGFPNVEGLDEAQACIRAVTEQYADMLKEKGFFEADVPCTILLIDMGAGTTDLVLCRHTPGPEGETEVLSTWPKKGEALFGGHTIDDILYTFITESFPDVRAVKRLSLDTFKTWKETVVSPTLWEGNTVNYFAALETIERALDVDLQFEINREKFESLTGDYLKILPGMINDILADAHVRGNDIDLVILTGGHSQWYFVKEMLLGNMPQFGEISLDKIRREPERIVSLARPQETVALGLAFSCIHKLDLEDTLKNDSSIKKESISSGSLDQRSANNICNQRKAVGRLEIKDVIYIYGRGAVAIVQTHGAELMPNEIVGKRVDIFDQLSGEIIKGDFHVAGVHILSSVEAGILISGISKRKLEMADFIQILFDDESFIEIPEENNSGMIDRGITKVSPDTLNDITWSFDNGILTISGHGKMRDYKRDIQFFKKGVKTDIPWHSLDTQIHQVVINEGVTSIGRFAFADCENITSVVLPNGVTSIGQYAFLWCKRLKSITIPVSVTNIGYCTVANCEMLKDIYYGGNQVQWNRITQNLSRDDALLSKIIHVSI